MNSISILALAMCCIFAFGGLSAVAGCSACGDPVAPEKAKATMHADKADTGKAVAREKEAVLNTEALSALIKAKTALTLLDARSGKYDDGKRIPGAKSLNAGSSDEDIAKVVPEKGALVVTYCAGPKCKASHELAERLRKAGYGNVIEYPQGIPGWIEAGNAVEQASK